MVTNNTSCPLCRTELKPTFYPRLLGFEQQMREPYQFTEVNRINFSRLDHEIVDISFINNHEILDVVLSNNNEYTSQAVVLLFRPEPVQQEPSGSIGITRVGSPFGLNVTYNDEPQPLEEVRDNSALHLSRSIMVGMGESSMYPNSMTLEARVRYGHITIEEVD